MDGVGFPCVSSHGCVVVSSSSRARLGSLATFAISCGLFGLMYRAL